MQAGDDSTRAAPAWRSRDYIVQPAQRRLLRRGEPVHVEERVFDLLALLLQHHHRALQQREIIHALWGRRPVSDATLRQVVYKARRVLDDDGRRQAVIRTLHGRSLQWVAPVEAMPAAPVDAPDRGGVDGDACVDAGGATMASTGSGPVARTGPPMPASDPVAVRPAMPVARPPRRFGWHRARALVALAGLIVLLSMRGPVVAAAANPRVAIEPIINATGDTDLDWIRNGLPGLIDGLLGQDGRLRMIDTRRVAREWARPARSWRDRERALRKATGADFVVGGQLRKLGDKVYELHLRILRQGYASADIVLTGLQPGLMAVDAVPRLRLRLAVDPRRAPVLPVPHDAFLAEAYARGVDLAGQGRNAQARMYFQLCVDNMPDFLPARLRLGLAQTTSDDLAGGQATFQRLLVRARQRGDTLMIGRALLALGHLSRQRAQEKRAIGLLQQAIPYLRRAGDPAGELDAHVYMAISAALSQRLTLADAELARASTLAGRHPELHAQRGEVLSARALVASSEGRQADALAAMRAVVADAPADRNQADIVNALNNFGLMLMRSGQPWRAFPLLAEAHRRARALHVTNAQEAAGFNLALILNDAGLPSPATTLADELVALGRQQGSRRWQYEGWMQRGIDELQQGRAAQALTSMHHADDLADAVNATSQALLERTLYEGMAAFQTDPQALSRLRHAFDRIAAGHSGEPGYRHRQHLLQALDAAAHGQTRSALSALRAARLDRHLDSDSDIDLRMVPWLVALADHDAAAAAIAAQGYDLATAREAGVLQLYAQWASQTGDTSASRRADARLALLRREATQALVRAGLPTSRLTAGT